MRLSRNSRLVVESHDRQILFGVLMTECEGEKAQKASPSSIVRKMEHSSSGCVRAKVEVGKWEFTYAGCLVACRCSKGSLARPGTTRSASRRGVPWCQPMRMGERRTRPTQTRGGARKANGIPATTVWFLPDRVLMGGVCPSLRAPVVESFPFQDFFFTGESPVSRTVTSLKRRRRAANSRQTDEWLAITRFWPVPGPIVPGLGAHWCPPRRDNVSLSGCGGHASLADAERAGGRQPLLEGPGGANVCGALATVLGSLGHTVSDLLQLFDSFVPAAPRSNFHNDLWNSHQCAVPNYDMPWRYERGYILIAWD